MSSSQLFRRILPLFLGACLSAVSSDFTPAGDGAGWLEKLWNLPVRTAPLPIHFSPPPAPCSVTALPAIADAEALQFEKSTAPSVGGLKPAMARALEKFRQLISAVGGTFELKSAYRPPAYQAHLQEVWFKWMRELRNNREPGCQTLRAQIGDEFAQHHLLESQKPVTSSDHTRGLAFDATVIVPRVARLAKRRVSLDRLALLAGIRRPDIFRDPVHFKLAMGRGGRRA